MKSFDGRFRIYCACIIFGLLSLVILSSITVILLRPWELPPRLRLTAYIPTQTPTPRSLPPTWTPTPPPTPTPFFTSDVLPVEIAVLNIHSEVQEDGTILNSAELSVAPLGFGSLQLSSPKTIKLGESGIIRLAIIPDSALVDLPIVSISPESTSEPSFVYEVNNRLQIYPRMIAELKGINFDIVSDGYPEKPVTSSSTVEWIWNITPRMGGLQSLFLSISVPVIIDQKKDILSVKPLKNIPIYIYVEVTPTPIPTKTLVPTATTTPIPVSEQIKRKLIENTSPIVIAFLGAIVSLITLYVNNKNTKRQKEIDELKKANEKYTIKNIDYEKKIAHLEAIKWWQFWRK